MKRGWRVRTIGFPPPGSDLVKYSLVKASRPFFSFFRSQCQCWHVFLCSLSAHFFVGELKTSYTARAKRVLHFARVKRIVTEGENGASAPLGTKRTSQVLQLARADRQAPNGMSGSSCTSVYRIVCTRLPLNQRWIIFCASHFIQYGVRLPPLLTILTSDNKILFPSDLLVAADIICWFRGE